MLTVSATASRATHIARFTSFFMRRRSLRCRLIHHSIHCIVDLVSSNAMVDVFRRKLSVPPDHITGFGCFRGIPKRLAKSLLWL
jgi:hypothetical protein